MRNHSERGSNKGKSYLWAVALNYMTKRRGRFFDFRHYFSVLPGCAAAALQLSQCTYPQSP
jgi:hypothetical protein